VRDFDSSSDILNVSAFAVGLTTIVYSRVGRLPWAFYHFLGSAFAQYGLISVDSIDPAIQALGFLLPGAAIVLLAIVWERDGARSLGVSKPYFGDLPLAVSAWLFYQIIFRFIFFRFYTPATHKGLGDSQVFLSLPARWSISLLVLDVVFEEFATRAYVIERVISFTGSRMLAGAVSLVLSISLHIPGRDVWQALRRIPMMSLLTVLYIWRRSILPGVFTHILMDAAVFVLLFHFPWLLLSVIHPLPASVLFTTSIVLWMLTQSIEKRLWSNRATIRREFQQLPKG
jgi:membrane protease YdiL (CAAX protease family)